MSDDRVYKGPKGLIESEGERIYYETFGRGDAVVFCHGYRCNHAFWYQQVPAFAPWYQVITWDQCGFGCSTDRARRAGPAAAVTDLEALLDHLGVERAHLIGQSMGGWAVTGFAIARPQRVQSVVLADTNGGISTPAIERILDATNRLRPPDPPIEGRSIGDHPSLGPQLVRRDPAKALLFEQLGCVGQPPPDFVLSRLKEMRHVGRDLQKLTMPVLMIVGSDDRICPLGVVNELAAVIVDSRVEVIANTGHSPYFEDPQPWNKTVLRFLDGIQ